MGRVSSTDLRAVLTFLGAAETGGGRLDAIPPSTLRLLRDLLMADEAEYFELRRADRAVLGAAQSSDMVSAPGSEEAMHAFGDQNPLNWRRWGPGDGAKRLSEQVRWLEFERTAFYEGFMRPNRLRDALKVWLASSERSVACIHLWRHDRSFSRREQDLLAILQHHLIAMRARALGSRARREIAARLTVREAQVLTWATRGDGDDEIAARLGTARATVRKHLEHAYAALGVHSRAEAIGRVLVGDTYD